MKKYKTLRILQKVIVITLSVYLLNAFYFWELNPKYWSERMPMCLTVLVLCFIIMVSEIENI